MANIAIDSPGLVKLVLGSEAIARGALEGGVHVVASYPGNPSTEITEALSEAAKKAGIYVEWSINEKVATEVAGAASFAGLRAMSAMKQNGFNVALDFFQGVSTSGIRGGFVLVVCDDPSGVTSTSEQDSRPLAKSLEFPLLDPGNFQEAKDMTRFALELSEQIGSVVILRSATRLQHAKGLVTFGEITKDERKAKFDTSKQFVAFPSLARHVIAKQRLAKAKELCKNSPFNYYKGPDKPELLIATSGSCLLYSLEALRSLGVEDRVGVMKIGTVWPLPEEFIREHIVKSNKVLVLEEVEPFLETHLKALMAEWASEIKVPIFYGRSVGPIAPTGELNPDIVIGAISEILGVKYEARGPNYEKAVTEMVQKMVPPRDFGLCAGCPHRASFWAVKMAEALDGRDGFATGDIGCYAFGLFPSGYKVVRVEQSMGTSVGTGYGFGKLGQFGMEQPVFALIGDGTFYHAGLPALVASVSNKSNVIFVILDNEITAMTGFQPTPASGYNAMGEETKKVTIEDICESVGAKVVIADPYDVEDARNKLLEMAQDEESGVRVVIMRRECAVMAARKGKLYNMWVDPDKCYGEECGCGNFCTRVFRCPGIILDPETTKAKIDEAICVGCGVCTQVCPHGAIIREPVTAKEEAKKEVAKV